MEPVGFPTTRGASLAEAKDIIVDLTRPEVLQKILTDYLSLGVCPALCHESVLPLAWRRLRILLPDGLAHETRGQFIRALQPGLLLFQLDPPLDDKKLAMLRSLPGLSVQEEARPELPDLEQVEEEVEALLKEEQDEDPSALETTAPTIDIDQLDFTTDLGLLPTSELEVPDDDGLSQDALPAEFEGLREDEPGGESDKLTGKESESSDLYMRVRNLSIHEKRQLARHGNKVARQLLIRDSNKAIHPFVIANPKVTLDEITEYAKIPNLAVEALKMMVQNTQWLKSRSVVFNLVRNPSLPVELAVKLLPRLGTNELRIVAHSGGIRTPVQAAARKLILG